MIFIFGGSFLGNSIAVSKAETLSKNAAADALEILGLFLYQYLFVSLLLLLKKKKN